MMNKRLFVAHNVVTYNWLSMLVVYNWCVVDEQLFGKHNKWYVVVIIVGLIMMNDGLVVVRLFDEFFMSLNLTVDHFMMTGFQFFVVVFFSAMQGSLVDSVLVEVSGFNVSLFIVVVIKFMVGLVVDMELNICVFRMFIGFTSCQVKRFLDVSRSTFVFVGLRPVVSWELFSAEMGFLIQFLI